MMKKVLIILFILMLIISVFQVGDMYAKFKTQRKGEYQSLLGVWSIKLNDIDISSGESIEFEITDHNLTADTDYVATNKIAPGIAGHFDLYIDPADTDVPVIYEVKVKTDQINQSQYQVTSIDNLFVNSADATDVITNTQVITSGNTHKAIIPLDKINDGYINNIKINFKWVNSDSNNVADTALGTSGTSSITVPVQVDVKQYMDGDTLE